MSRNKISAVILLLIIILIIVFNQFKIESKKYFVKPVRTIIAGPYNGIANFFSSLFVLRRENEMLKTEIQRLVLENYKLKEYKLENERLKKSLKFKKELYYKDIIPAKIIALGDNRDVGNIVVNVGRVNKVKENLPIISKDGIVGFVTEVYDETSLAQLLQNVNTKVSCMIEDRRVKGILEFENENLGVGIMRYVPIRSDVKVNDIVISSGLGGIFPKGLRIGKVIKIGNDPLGLFKNVYVELFSDFSSLEEVYILTR